MVTPEFILDRIQYQIQKSNDEIEFEKSVPFIIKSEDQHIVCGIIYEPDTPDTDGDQADAETIQKAIFDWMANEPKFKINHKKNFLGYKILECYIAPSTLDINGHEIKKGTAILTLKILDESVWADIKEGRLTGFSMSGTAERVEEKFAKEDKLTELTEMFKTLGIEIGDNVEVPEKMILKTSLRTIISERRNTSPALATALKSILELLAKRLESGVAKSADWDTILEALEESEKEVEADLEGVDKIRKEGGTNFPTVANLLFGGGN